MARNRPELHVSIVELDMIRRVDIRTGPGHVTVALTVPGCPLRNEITRRVTSAVEALPGVRQVDVELTVMTPPELEAVRARDGPATVTGGTRTWEAPVPAPPQRGAAAGHEHGSSAAPLGHEAGRPNPFGPQSRPG